MSYINDAGALETSYSTTGYLSFKFNVRMNGDMDATVDEIELTANASSPEEQIIELPYTTGIS